MGFNNFLFKVLYHLHKVVFKVIFPVLQLRWNSRACYTTIVGPWPYCSVCCWLFSYADLWSPWVLGAGMGYDQAEISYMSCIRSCTCASRLWSLGSGCAGGLNVGYTSQRMHGVLPRVPSTVIAYVKQECSARVVGWPGHRTQDENTNFNNVVYQHIDRNVKWCCFENSLTYCYAKILQFNSFFLLFFFIINLSISYIHFECYSLSKFPGKHPAPPSPFLSVFPSPPSPLDPDLIGSNEYPSKSTSGRGSPGSC